MVTVQRAMGSLAVGSSKVVSLAVGSPASILAGLRLEVCSWRNEELGVKDNNVLGSIQVGESAFQPWDMAEGFWNVRATK